MNSTRTLLPLIADVSSSAYPLGSVNQNVLPLPSSLSTPRWPPSLVTIRCTIDSPMPNPRSSLEFGRVNSAKMRALSSGAMPRPLS